jgi:MFS family permease
MRVLNQVRSAHSRPIVALLVVQLLSGIVLAPQRFFFPIYLEEQLGFSAVLISALVALGLFLGMVASLVGGTLSDTLGRKWTLILGLGGFALGSLVYLFSSPALIVLVWVASGLGLAFHALGGQSYLIDAAGAAHLGVLSALYNWGFTLGGALSSPVAGIILDSRGYPAMGAALFGVSLLTLLGAAGFMPPVWGESDAEGVPWQRALSGYGRLLQRRPIALLGLLRFLPTCYYGMATVLIPLLMNRTAANKTSVALYAMLSQLLASLAQIVAGRAVDRWQRRVPTLVAFGLLLLSAAGLATFATQLWSLFLFGVIGISSAWALSTLMPVLVSDVTAPRERGRVLGMLHFLWNIAMMLGSLGGGALVEVTAGLPFLAAALVCAGAIVTAVLYFRQVEPAEPAVQPAGSG